MSNSVLVDYVRELVPVIRSRGQVDDDMIQCLEDIQDKVEAIYENYESQNAPVGAEVLRELMMEAMQLIYQGIDEILQFADEDNPELLTIGLSQVEEGNDVLESVRHAILNDQSWTSASALS